MSHPDHFILSNYRIFERSVKAKTVFLSQSAQQQTVVDKYPSREDDKYPSREDVR